VTPFAPIIATFDAAWDASRAAMAADLRPTPATDAYEAGYHHGHFHAKNGLPFDATAPADVPYLEWVKGYRAGFTS
jgi:hypothetical protein